MCAILFSNQPSLEQSKFKEALSLMNHRGPDNSSIKVFENIKLGHNRLKILDLDNHANQPFLSKDKRYIIIFNGEIYNYKELAKRYRINTKTTCDTEILLELYIKFGKKVLNELNGMFAFLIFDTKQKTIFTARDRLGIKPLYYYMQNNTVIFSSEIAPILYLINDIEYDEIGLRQYLKVRTFFNGHTLYKNISMMQAGSYFENGKFHKYWNFEITEQKPPSDEELYSLVKSSVDYRTISDVSVGAYLSGGIDSSIITGLSNVTNTWTVGYEDNNEFEYSSLVASFQNIKHHKTILQYKDFLPTLENLIEKRKEPLSVPNEILLYNMTQNVKQQNTVILSGEGADELMFGYDRIFRWANSNKWNIEEFDNLYSYGNHKDNEILDYIIEPYKHYKSNIDIIAAFFQISHLHGLLRRLDFTTMLNSVEARVPFVDHRLVERLAGVPFEYRMENNIVKAPLKRVFSKILPKKILNRKKVGFPVQLKNIFHSDAGMDSWLKTNLDILQRG